MDSRFYLTNASNLGYNDGMDAALSAAFCFSPAKPHHANPEVRQAPRWSVGMCPRAAGRAGLKARRREYAKGDLLDFRVARRPTGNCAKPGISDDVSENKDGYGCFGKYVRELSLFKYNGLCAFRGDLEAKKRGVPKNAGISDDVYENKGQKKCLREHPTMFMKTHDLAFYPTMLMKIQPVNLEKDNMDWS